MKRDFCDIGFDFRGFCVLMMMMMVALAIAQISLISTFHLCGFAFVLFFHNIWSRSKDVVLCIGVEQYTCILNNYSLETDLALAWDTTTLLHITFSIVLHSESTYHTYISINYENDDDDDDDDDLRNVMIEASTCVSTWCRAFTLSFNPFLNRHTCTKCRLM